MAWKTESSGGLRGPVEHEIRRQIIAAATDHFRQYGYSKTTITDIASAIGFSKAYVYKFFASKRAIGEAISIYAIDEIVNAADADVVAANTASDRIRWLFRSITRNSLRLLHDEPQFYDIVTLAVAEEWSCNRRLDEGISERLRLIVLEGRRSGEFERKTPLDETCRAIAGALKAYTHPLMLSRDPDSAADQEEEVVGLVLRSLAVAEPPTDTGGATHALDGMPKN